ncbi:protein HtrL [Ditylenchus destructor]|nr:protein HtrL [Ditylenchus destructor]
MAYYSSFFLIRNIFSDSTLVTAFFALGPPNSVTFKINLERYHSYMLQVLQLRLPLVMFTNEHSIDFVHKTRKAVGLENFTKVYNIGLRDLPLFKQYDLFHDILYQEQKGRTWKPHWNVALKDRPETASVEYMMLENSKSFFLKNASTENSFNTTHFVWLDANYGHGNSSVFPYNYEWAPKFEKGKISILKLAPTNDSITLYNKDKLYRQNITLVGGEFLAGDAQTIDKFHKTYERKIVDIAYNDRMVDDDETMLVILINEMPELFDVVQGEWFNVFHLF